MPRSLEPQIGSWIRASEHFSLALSHQSPTCHWKALLIPIFPHLLSTHSPLHPNYSQFLHPSGFPLVSVSLILPSGILWYLLPLTVPKLSAAVLPFLKKSHHPPIAIAASPYLLASFPEFNLMCDMAPFPDPLCLLLSKCSPSLVVIPWSHRLPINTLQRGFLFTILYQLESI